MGPEYPAPKPYPARSRAAHFRPRRASGAPQAPFKGGRTARAPGARKTPWPEFQAGAGRRIPGGRESQGENLEGHGEAAASPGFG